MPAPRGVAAFALVAVLVAAPSVASAGEEAGDAPRKVTEAVLTRDAGPTDAHNSPAVAVNPQDRDNIVVVDRVDARFLSATLHVTTDGGQSWSRTVLPLPEGTGAAEGPPVQLDENGDVVFVETQRRYAPDVAFAPDGTLYVSYVNLMGQGNVPDNLWVARSDDGGLTLSDPVRAAGRLVYQARLAVDDAGVLHVIYLQAEEVGAWALAAPAPVVTVRSDDGGRTFSDPVTVSDPQRQRVAAASPVVTSDGDLVVLYQDFKGDARDFQNLEGPPWDGPTALVVTRSDDGGRTFAPGVVIDDGVVLARRFIVFLPPFPSLAAGPDGAVYVSWTDARDGSEDVFLRRSGDGGDTWDDRIEVSEEEAADATAQYLPSVSVAADGRIDVAYLDRTGDAATHVMLATSADRGGTFVHVRLTDEPFDDTIGPQTLDSFVMSGVGSRLGLASWEGGAVAAWTDTRLGAEQPDLGRQDIAVATVAGMPAAAGADPDRRWWLWGTVVAGGVLVGAVLLRRRGRPGSVA